MTMIIKSADLPVSLSSDLVNRANGFFLSIQLFGIYYYVPVTHTVKKLLGIRVVNGTPVFKSFRQQEVAEDFIRDMLNSMYLQIRDTVGAEIKQELSQQMQDSLSKVFAPLIANKVDAKLAPELPTPQNSGPETP